MSEENQPKKRPAQPPRKPGPEGPAAKFDFNMMIFDLWNGRIELKQVFWIYYFAVILGLFALSVFLPMLSSVLGLFSLVWAGFMVKPIWIAADDYKGPQHYALLAKGAAVLIGIAVALNILAF